MELVPGLALATTITGHDTVGGAYVRVPPTLVVPWLPLIVVAVAVPVVAGAIAWVSVHCERTVTRRLG